MGVVPNAIQHSGIKKKTSIAVKLSISEGRDLRTNNWFTNVLLEAVNKQTELLAPEMAL